MSDAAISRSLALSARGEFHPVHDTLSLIADLLAPVGSIRRMMSLFLAFTPPREVITLASRSSCTCVQTNRSPLAARAWPVAGAAPGSVGAGSVGDNGVTSRLELDGWSSSHAMRSLPHHAEGPRLLLPAVLLRFGDVCC